MFCNWSTLYYLSISIIILFLSIKHTDRCLLDYVTGVCNTSFVFSYIYHSTKLNYVGLLSWFELPARFKCTNIYPTLSPYNAFLEVFDLQCIVSYSEYNDGFFKYVLDFYFCFFIFYCIRISHGIVVVHVHFFFIIACCILH